MTTHMFNVEVANDIGVIAGAMFEMIAFWVEKNRANNHNLRDGRYWTYNSLSAWSEIVTYASKKQVRKALDDLKSHGYILAENLNDDKRNRTLWYTLTDYGLAVFHGYTAPFAPQGKSTCPTGQVSVPSGANDYSIYNTVTVPVDISVASSPEGTSEQMSLPIEPPKPKPKSKSKPKPFVPPTVEEVRQYCEEERGNGIDPQYFVDYYAANDWCDSKGNPVKSWKQRVLTWEGREKSREAKNRHQVGSWDY